MEIETLEDANALAIAAADKIQALIERNNTLDKPTVLGLATGSTPKPLYAELIRRKIDFSNVITFNLDEYLGVPHDDKESYYTYMHKELFDHININSDNINMLDGEVSEKNIAAHCAAYEQEIRDVGGIDLQILGIGGEGHIGFNEAVEKDETFDRASRTRKVALSERTKADNNPPSGFAISMGVGTIMEAKEILLLANGELKAPVMHKMLEEGSLLDVAELPARILRSHRNCTVMVDEAASSWLTKVPHKGR